MLKRVADCISRYSMFKNGQSAGVAVSGGADSVCLLHVLAELAPRWALRLSVLHMDHQLRGEESCQDAEFVRDLARRLGLEAHIREVDVGRLRDETGDNLEQAARRARRGFFQECLRSGLVDRVALGHTRSDQAETVLFRLLRGCGAAGLAGILPVTAEGFVRPLLEVDRTEVERYLRERGIAWREDSSNRDPAYARNRIRRQLLPSLVRDWNPALPATLARMAMLAHDEEEYWDGEIARLAAAHLVRESGAVLVRAGDLLSLARPVARRLIRRAIGEVKGDLRRVDLAHVEEILRLARRKQGSGRIRIPDVDVARSFEWIRLSRPAGPQEFRLAVPVPGSVALPTRPLSLSLSLSDWDETDCGLEWKPAWEPLQVRNWRPGDKYRPMGAASDEKIKDLFQRRKIPSWERASWPILTAGPTILWAWQFGPAADFVATPRSRRVLKIGVDADCA